MALLSQAEYTYVQIGQIDTKLTLWTFASYLLHHACTLSIVFTTSQVGYMYVPSVYLSL